ncbi:helix-turn-helix domain-containing protein [Halobacterium noricense]|uniref:helix-turn-helix domain-containing protein n=1 Tax=Halobacterium noricense TaxID=223182 RepID=UPI001E592487|nr:bacterio-opsin activator domain-containing protein [Halobacterium noricense]UHH26224.1 helix-turn-helix domain-containing protein [Halobacterium noricense]
MAGEPAAFAELEFAVEDTAYPAVRVSRTLDCRLELLDSLQTDDGFVMFVRLADGAADELAERAAAGSLDGEIDALQTVGDEVVVEFSPTESVVGTLAHLGVLTQTATTTDDAARITAVVPADADLQYVVDRVQDAHPSAAFVGKRSCDIVAPFVTESGVRSLVADALTDRQWEAAYLAYERGYFDEPRGCSQAELAAAMDISQKTFSQHLHAAIWKVFDVVFGG